MVKTIKQALEVIKKSEYADVKILRRYEGKFADEQVYGFYVSDKDVPDSFGYGLLVSEDGTIDCLSGVVPMAILNSLKRID